MPTSPSTITVHVPAVLRGRCEGTSELALPGENVRAVLQELERRYPALYVCVCDETGAIRRHINVFVNEDHVRDRDGLDTALGPKDVVTILPAVSGGSPCRTE